MISKLSIIIPVLNEANYLPRLLESITQQTYAGKLQIIVVDGHSSDKTVEIAKSFASRISDLLVLDSKPDIGHQRNIGVEHAKYQYLLFLDADVILPPTVLKELISKVQKRQIAEPFIIGTMHTSVNVGIIDRFFLIFVYALLFFSWLAKVPAINGDFILTTRTNHRNLKGFTEGALLGEDIDYAIRSVRSGATYRYFLRPKVIASDRRVREVGRWRLLLLWSRGYLHVIRHGPIFPGQGYQYPSGHYGSPSTEDSSSNSSRTS